MSAPASKAWPRRIAVVALAASAIVGVAACSSTTATSNTPAMGAVNQSSGQHMSANEFSSAIKAPGTVLLDVRTPAEFNAGHLPQATNIDFENPNFSSQIAALDKNVPYALYCRSGNRSGQALAQMSAAGFTQVYDLAGGMGSWQAMGGATMMGGT
ncbi:MAG: rhodanese-like domain-containing protein [Actinomycetes bacterium]